MLQTVLNQLNVYLLSFSLSTDTQVENLADSLSGYLASQGINLMDCRGQSYDNAGNISGRYGDMQARLKDINPIRWRFTFRAWLTF